MKRFALFIFILCFLAFCYSVSVAQIRYFDANGNEVSESEYRELIKEWYKSRSKAEERIPEKTDSKILLEGTVEKDRSRFIQFHEALPEKSEGTVFGNRYFDADGNEISEAEYHVVIKKWRESCLKTPSKKSELPEATLVQKAEESLSPVKADAAKPSDDAVSEKSELPEATPSEKTEESLSPVKAEAAKPSDDAVSEKSELPEAKPSEKAEEAKPSDDAVSEKSELPEATPVEKTEESLSPVKADAAKSSDNAVSEKSELPEAASSEKAEEARLSDDAVSKKSDIQEIPLNEKPAEKSAQEPVKKYPLWSVQTEKNTVYLLGSIHVMREADYPLPEPVMTAYDICKKIAFEADPGEADIEAKVIQLGQYSEGESLVNNISSETYKALEKRLSVSGISMTQFSRFKPWMCALTLTMSEFRRLGFDPNYGIDAYFLKKTRTDQKTAIFLESAEFQINLFASLERIDQEAVLQQTLKELDIIERDASEMVTMWKSGDAEKLAAVFKESLNEYPKIYEQFVVQRNKNWIPEIERLLQENEKAMVVVGYGHLVGEKSLIDLLREKGYNVVQVSSSLQSSLKVDSSP